MIIEKSRDQTIEKIDKNGSSFYETLPSFS